MRVNARLDKTYEAKLTYLMERCHNGVSSVLKDAIDSYYEKIKQEEANALADASLVVLAEEIGHGRILTTDTRDFQTYRWKERRPFQNLLDLH